MRWAPGRSSAGWSSACARPAATSSSTTRFSLRSIGRLNKRDHRKLAIFDGRRAYVFGHGFGEEWDHDTRGDRAWRDTAARVEGPAVNALQAVFAQNWMGETGEVLAGARYFPPPGRGGQRRGAGGGELAARRRFQRFSPLSADDLRGAARGPHPEPVFRAAAGGGARCCSPRSTAAFACASSPRGRAPTTTWCAGPATTSSPSSSVAAPRSTSSNPRSITRRSWWSIESGATWARRTSTTARSTSTPRSGSASSTKACATRSPTRSSATSSARDAMAPERWRRRPLRKRAVEWAAYLIREQL